MRQFTRTLVLGLILAGLGCGPAVPGDAEEPQSETDQDKEPARIASGDKEGDYQEPFDAPPFLFEPRSHPPRYRYGEYQQPDLGSLPRLKMRYDKCFKVQREKRPIPIARGGRAVKRKQVARPRKSVMVRGSGRGGAVEGLLAPPSPPPMSAPEESMDMAAEAPAGEAAAATPPRLEEAESEKKEAISVADEDDRIAEGEPLPGDYEDWGAAIYLSNDDTMSLSSAQRVIYAIDKFLPLPLQHIRPHELLNYFSFQTSPVADGNDFSVLGDIAPEPREHGIYSLGLAVKGRPVDRASRRNAAITLVIDRSGSMSDEGRMDYLKRGLLRMVSELKTGDLVHMVIFDHEVCVPLENFAVGRDDEKKLKKVINALKPRGSTDLHRGLSRGYEIADQAYMKDYTNRVIMITDALANTGVTNEQMISMISKYYDKRRLRLSGVGVGRDFNDSLLDRLTERGKGAYVFLGSEAEVDAVFGSRFISLIETTALDVHFRLHLPPSLRMNVFYGEESSTVKADVQEVHYFANTSQLFLSDLMARGGELRPQDGVMLTIEYEDPETGEELVEEYAFTLGELEGEARNVKKARLIMAWIDMLAQMAARAVPAGYRHGPGGAGTWEDPEGWQRCEDGRVELERLSQEVAGDPEVRRVLELWEKYCARYERPRRPVKRQIVAPEDSWPGARSGGTR